MLLSSNKRLLPYGPAVLTFDVEDWPQSTLDVNLPITVRAANNTRKLLHLLSELDVKGTFFILGKFAEEFPEIVKEIHLSGHEIGCHGYGHVVIFMQSREEFRKDIRIAKQILEDLIGQPVRGYRAPDFSIIKKTLWALEVLAEEGFLYDSSIFPVVRPNYGIPDWPIHPIRVGLPNGLKIIELPLASLPLWGKNRPIGGGGYHRLLPGFLVRLLARRLLKTAPFIFYCHPYEFDKEEFQNLAWRVPLKIRLHQGLGRSRFNERFIRFVRTFGGRPVKDLLKLPIPDT